VIPDWPTLQHREKKQEAVPVYIVPLEDINAKEEEGPVTLEAEFSIPNPKKVRWFKNKLEIFLGNNIHIEHVDCMHRLTIKKLSQKDGGKYTLSCDDIKTSAWLNITGIPNINPLIMLFRSNVGRLICQHLNILK